MATRKNDVIVAYKGFDKDFSCRGGFRYAIGESHSIDSLFISGPSKPEPGTPEGGDFAIMDGGTNIIAEVFHRVSIDRTQDARAIATLFAAAPDLLRELQKVYDCLGGETYDWEPVRKLLAEVSQRTVT